MGMVLLQVRNPAILATESARAEFARERLLAKVNVRVSYEPINALKGLAAAMADKRVTTALHSRELGHRICWL